MVVIHFTNGATDPLREYSSYEVITVNGLLWLTGSNSWEPHE